MKINQVTPSNTTVNISKPAFTGRIITKGKWTKNLKDAFFNSKAIQDLASGEKDVIGRLKYKSAPSNDYNHTWGEPLFKLSLEMKNPHPTLVEKVKSFLGLSRKVINEFYHSEDSLAKKINEMSKEFCEHRMTKNLK